MKIIFVSLPAVAGWGGSEELWADAARAALDEESMPIAVMEAMYCGRPCLVTDVGDNAALVRDGVTGFLAPGARREAVSAALERAWQSRERWPELGLQAHAIFTSTRDPNPGRTVLTLLTRNG